MGINILSSNFDDFVLVEVVRFFSGKFLQF